MIIKFIYIRNLSRVLSMWRKLESYFHLLLIFFIVLIFLKFLDAYRELLIRSFKENGYAMLGLGIPLSLVLLIKDVRWYYRWSPPVATAVKILKFCFGIYGIVLLFGGYMELFDTRIKLGSGLLIKLLPF